MRILRDQELGWADFCIYWSDKYLGFNFPLHTGWQSSPYWMKGGWEYYECAILFGNKTTGKSRWFNLPKVIIPAKLVRARRMMDPHYRNAFKEVPKKDKS
jgi:hypothetical protein